MRKLRANLSTVMVVMVALSSALVAVGHTLWRGEAAVAVVVLTGSCNADFIAASTDDPPGTVDPGYSKDVATCVARVLDESTLEIIIDNAYPSYTCTLTTTIHNAGTVPEDVGPAIIQAPPELTVTEICGPTEIELLPGEDEVERFTIHVEQPMEQNATYTFTIRKPVYCRTDHEMTGTIGFWKNWDSHNTFTQREIEAWLSEIDGTSEWLGPTSVAGMVAMLEAHGGPGATPESRFLAQYLATRLGERSGILSAAGKHDITGVDTANYLGLDDPADATLDEIIEAIESKSDTPSAGELNVMHDVCDGLNNRQI
jgi:hypothetical protein